MAHFTRFVMSMTVLVPAVVFAAEPAKKPPVQGFAIQRVQEKMGRALVARPIAGSKIYLSWRLFQTDAKITAFNVYRRAGGQTTRINREPVTTTTDFIDQTPPSGPLEYFVRPTINGTEGDPSDPASADSSAEPLPYISFKLDLNYRFEKLAIADLDGDGRYDFILKQPNGNVDPYAQYWRKSTSTYKIDAYNADGKFLWRHDLGWSIEAGIWYSPMVTYDLDGDGKAEVICKAGEGDPRDAEGKVQSGPEYVLVLDGMTGKEKARIDWPSRDGMDDYNYYCRNQLGIAYLDGKTPFLLVQRGTYKLIKLYAYEFHDNKLREVWHWFSTDETPNWNGQGADCLRAADIDGDGRDEVVIGSGVIDDNGQGLWCTHMGHPDHVYIGDLDPNRPGLEIYYGMETKQEKNGMCMVDAATGKILWGIQQPTRHVHDQGLVADLDPRYPGCETYSADTDPQKAFAWALLHDAKGNVIGNENLGGFAPRAAYWDADVQREVLGRGFLNKLNGPRFDTRIEGAFIGTADILGDWREEIITSYSGEFRIYATTIPAKDRRPCLMQDPFYRADVSTASQGYYQIPTPKVLPGSDAEPKW